MRACVCGVQSVYSVNRNSDRVFVCVCVCVCVCVVFFEILQVVKLKPRLARLRRILIGRDGPDGQDEPQHHHRSGVRDRRAPALPQVDAAAATVAPISHSHRYCELLLYCDGDPARPRVPVSLRLRCGGCEEKKEKRGAGGGCDCM